MRLLTTTLSKAFILLSCMSFGCSVAPSTSPAEYVVKGNDYVVDGKFGSDTNPGTQARPWKTIQKAADTLPDGDTVIIMSGNYPERVQVTRSNMVFQAQSNVISQGFTITGNNIVVSGFYITNQFDSITDGAGFYVIGDTCLLENNHIFFTPNRGIYITPTSDGCSIRNNKVERVGWTGITVEGNNTLVENNEVWGTVQRHPYSSLSYDADGIRFFNDGNIFRGNYIHDISSDDPANATAHIDGFQTWDSPNLRAGSNSVFENNIIILPGNTTAGFQLEGGAHDIIIKNNVIMALAGIRSYKNTESPYTTPYNLSVLNNTFIVGLAYDLKYGPIGATIMDATGVVIKNNIFTELPTRPFDISEGMADYNLVYNSDGRIPSGTIASHDLWQVDPLFINPLSNDFHLHTDSPACSAGENNTYIGAFPCH